VKLFITAHKNLPSQLRFHAFAASEYAVEREIEHTASHAAENAALTRAR